MGEFTSKAIMYWAFLCWKVFDFWFYILPPHYLFWFYISLLFSINILYVFRNLSISSRYPTFGVCDPDLISKMYKEVFQDRQTWGTGFFLIKRNTERYGSSLWSLPFLCLRTYSMKMEYFTVWLPLGYIWPNIEERGKTFILWG